MTGPEDRQPAAHGRGRMRASHADRDQVIEVLKTAFAHGRLGNDELGARVGRALASRTYAELAALTADIPAAPPAPAPTPRRPSRARNRAPVSNNVRGVAIGLVVGLSLAAVILFSDLFGAIALLGLLASPFAAMLVPVVIANSSQQRRSRGQLPSQPGQGGQPPEVQRPGQAGHDPAPPLPAPTRPAPTCGPTARGRAGRILPGGVLRHRWSGGHRPAAAT